jgi:predicted unusual protein kinase regulating ubiquinone biosynthesis (AarF/ABC1/UbiB family)
LVDAGLNSNPIQDVFSDVTPTKLIGSSWRVFWRIYRLQGLAGALRVIPIIWAIVVTVRGFSRFHAKEYARLREIKATGADMEEAVLTAEEMAEYRQLGKWLRERLHSLGPTFIKIGQTLSTRADLVPLPAMVELATLQEEVQPFESEVAFNIIQRELGAAPDKLFAQFDPVPIAAASLSQAYKAVLRDGRDVVVKVQRPNLGQLIAHDVQTLGAIADEVMTYPKLCRHTNWPEVVDEFARTTFEEIDYIREGRNADRFRHDHRQNEYIYIPRIIWRLTGRRVLTIEVVWSSGGKD